METLQQLLNETETLEIFWSNVLGTHIQHSNKDFHYILSTFSEWESYSTDILSGKTIVEVGILYETALNYYLPDGKKNNGVYYTPNDVATFMAEECINSSNLTEGVLLDPCCGVGNLTFTLLETLPDSVDREKFLLNNLLCFDIDPLSLLTARIMVTLRWQKNIPDLFHKLENVYVIQDYLDTVNDGSLFKSEHYNYDTVLMNPPYVNGVKDDRFITSDTGDLYSYFMEIALANAENVVTVTPQSFTSSEKFRSLRKLILDKFTFDCYVFDNMPDSIFNGRKIGTRNTNVKNSVRAAVSVFRQKHSGSVCRITPMLRWKAGDRKQLFGSVREFLASPAMSVDVFPKVPKQLVNVYDVGVLFPRLGSLFSDGVTEFRLVVPSTPRYFLTAASVDLQRTGKHTLFFRNENDYRLGYVLLNSFYSYFWWRAVGDGMSLTFNTLRSLPMPELLPNVDVESVVEKLLLSEVENMVVKTNSGKQQENVKHPVSLRRECSVLFFDRKVVHELEKLIRNSVF